jgi:hypothetical protein
VIAQNRISNYCSFLSNMMFAFVACCRVAQFFQIIKKSLLYSFIHTTKTKKNNSKREWKNFLAFDFTINNNSLEKYMNFMTFCECNAYCLLAIFRMYFCSVIKICHGISPFILSSSPVFLLCFYVECMRPSMIKFE